MVAPTTLGTIPSVPVIEMYLRHTCPYCVMAIRLLSSKVLEWTEIDIDAEPQRRQEMIDRSGRYTVPQIFVGGTHVGGFDDLYALESAGRLDRLLADASS